MIRKEFNKVSSFVDKFDYSHIKDTDMAFMNKPEMQDVMKAYLQKNAVFYFDIDGTLLKDEPGKHKGLKRDLEIQEATNKIHDHLGKSAFITGRPIVYVDSKFPESKMTAIGEHGAWISHQGRTQPLVNVDSTYLDHMYDLIDGILDEVNSKVPDPDKHVYIEDDKIYDLTIQADRCDDPDGVVAYVWNRLEDELKKSKDHKNAQEPFVLQGGTELMDVLHPEGRKDSAIRSFRRRLDISMDGNDKPLEVYFGDSEGDYPGMEEVKNNGGIVAWVGPKTPPPYADIHIPSWMHMRMTVKIVSELQENPALVKKWMNGPGGNGQSTKPGLS